MAVDWLALGVVLSASLAGAVSDVLRHRIPNWLTLPLLAAGVAWHASQGTGNVGGSLLGALIGLGLLLGPYAFGLMGAADVKLLAAVGAWLGPSETWLVFVVSSLAAGIYAAIQIAARGELREGWCVLRLILEQFALAGVSPRHPNLVAEFDKRPDRRWRVIPYGASIPLGVLGVAAVRLWSG